jgi:hypothetical protein
MDGRDRRAAHEDRHHRPGPVVQRRLQPRPRAAGHDPRLGDLAGHRDPGFQRQVIDLLAVAADDNPNIPTYRAVLARCAVEAGSADLAREVLEHFGSGALADLPEDSNRFLALAVLADACASLEERRWVPLLLEQLRPYTDLHVVLNCYGGGGASWGPASLQLGRLAALVGDAGASSRWLAQARTATLQVRAPLVSRRIDAPV